MLHKGCGQVLVPYTKQCFSFVLADHILWFFAVLTGKQQQQLLKPCRCECLLTSNVCINITKQTEGISLSCSKVFPLSPLCVSQV